MHRGIRLPVGIIFLALFSLSGPGWSAEPEQKATQTVTSTDDLGRTVRLPRPAERIVSLAPDLTELLFSLGVGDRIKGAVDYSDYPEEAKKIPRIGSFARIDLEAILALKPDLVVAWPSGNSPASLERIKALGIPMFEADTGRIDGIADTLERLAPLVGTPSTGTGAAQHFRAEVARLRAAYADMRTLRVFYQLSGQPVMTVNGQQIISSVIELCGGRNVFADLAGLAPVVSVEAVLAARPEVIIASGMSNDEPPDWIDNWRRWPQIPAVARHHVYAIPPDLIHRQSLRIVEGARLMCEKIDQARRQEP